MANVTFHKGLLANLPATKSAGSIYITTDERAVYFDYDAENRIRIGDFISVASISALPESASTDALYYAEAENVLAKFNGTTWVQINPDTKYEFASGDTNGTFKFKSNKDSQFTEVAIKGLKEVAFSGKAADITVEDAQNKFTATDLEGVLLEIFQAINVGGTGSVVTVEKDESVDGIATRYTIKQGGVAVSPPIDIPKDLVIKSGQVLEDADASHPGSWIKIELQNTTDVLWIDVRTLIEYVTAGDDTATIHVDISADHKVTANVINGSIGNDQLSTEVKKRISDLEGLVGSTSVQSQINSALSWIDF